MLFVGHLSAFFDVQIGYLPPFVVHLCGSGASNLNPCASSNLNCYLMCPILCRDGHVKSIISGRICSLSPEKNFCSNWSRPWAGLDFKQFLGLPPGGGVEKFSLAESAPYLLKKNFCSNWSRPWAGLDFPRDQNSGKATHTTVGTTKRADLFSRAGREHIAHSQCGKD